MPLTNDRPLPGIVDLPPEPVIPTPPTERGVWRSAFDTENDIIALRHIIEQQSFEPDLNFNLWEYGKEDPMFQQFPNEFVGVGSAPEYEFVKARIQSAIASRRTLENAGVGGWLASTIAAIASPTILIPTGTVASGLRAGAVAAQIGARSAAAGGTGVAIQEGILQSAPTDRAVEESLLNIAFGTVAAGALGAGVGVIGREAIAPVVPQVDEVYVPDEAPSSVPPLPVTEVPILPETEVEVKAVRSSPYPSDPWHVMVNGQKVGEYYKEKFRYDEGVFSGRAEIFGSLMKVEEEIRQDFLDGSVGAAQVAEIEIEPINPTRTFEAEIGAEGDVKLDSTLGLANTIGKISPTVRGYTNKYSPTVRAIMQRLSGGGLLHRTPDGRLSAHSDVETRAKTWEGVYYKAREKSDVAIQKYHLENQKAADRLSAKEIREQASDAIDGGLDNFDGPNVVKEVARAYQEEVFIPFAKEAKRLEFTGHEHWRDPKTYVPHMARRAMVAADHEEFVEILTEYFGEHLVEQTSKKISALEARAERRLQEAEDLTKTDEEVVVLRAELEKLEKDINDGLTPEAQKLLKRAGEMRARAKVIDDPTQKKALYARAKEIETSNDELARRYKRVKGIRRRRSNLNKTGLAIREAIEKKDVQIRKVEAQNLRTINGLVVKAKTVLDRIKKETGAVAKVKDLNQFEEDVQTLMSSIDKFAEEYLDYAALTREATSRSGKMVAGAVINNIGEADFSIARFPNPASLRRERGTVRGMITKAEKAGKDTTELRARETLLSERLIKLEEDLNVVKNNTNRIPLFGKEVGVDAGLVNRLNAKLLDLNAAREGVIRRRAIRIGKMEEQRAQLDPEEPKRRAEQIRARMQAQVTDLYAKLEEKGIKFDGGKFDVANLARKQAEVIAAKFTGEVGRIPLTATLLERGPELERTLNIDPLRVWSNGRRFADFLERDIDVLSRLYTRTVGSDFEVYREFGSLSPFGRASDGVNKTGLLARIQDDFEKARAKAREEFGDDEAKLAKENSRIARSRRAAERDIQAVIDRIRHLRGIPEDPASIPWRAGRAVLNYNTLRLMGSVVVSSLPDPIRLVMKQGMKSMFRDGFTTLFTNMKAIQGLRSEVKSFGVGLDLLNHGRLAAIADVFDDYVPGTRPERMLQYATNNMGRIALFDYWNAFWKQTAGVMTMQRIVHDLENVLTGTGKVGDAERFLARAGVNEEMAERIWTQLTETPRGAERYKGVLVPNVSEWTDPDAARAFKAAILRVVDDTIITPGVERPLLFDGSMIGRMMFQFRSFAFASLTKTVMHGAQELKYGNLNIPIGIAMSVGMGMMGWWVWSQLVGEDARKRMEKAELDKWLDEGIARSGLLGPMQEAVNLAQRIPWLNQYASLSGEAPVKSYSPFRDPFLNAFGPTVGLIEDLQTIALSAPEPRQATANAITRLLPLHNLMYARPLMNAGKEAAAEELGF